MLTRRSLRYTTLSSAATSWGRMCTDTDPDRMMLNVDLSLISSPWKYTNVPRWHDCR